MDKRRCVWCGKEFQPKSPKQMSCKDKHFRPCAGCGAPLEVKESYQNYIKYGPRRCEACRRQAIQSSHRSKSSDEKYAIEQKRRQTLVDRYGVDNPMKSIEIKAKADKTILDKYGVTNVSQSPEIQNRIRENSRIKYGTDHPSQNSEVRSRMIAGMVAKYGRPTPINNSDIRAKIEATNLSRYGTPYGFSSNEIKAKIRSTCLSKYGVEYAAQAEPVIEKRLKTNREKYGASAYIFSDEYLNTLILDPSKSENASQFRSDPEAFILSHYSDHPTYRVLSADTGLSETSISYHICKNNIQHLITYTLSKMEEEVLEYIHELDPNIKCIRHERSILKGKELDIYLPDFRLGIECNPTSTHNSDVPFKTSDPLSTTYHKDKSVSATRAGIRIFHVFGYMWVNRPAVVKSMIAYLLNRSDKLANARDCTVNLVDYKVCMDFLNTNHIQGRTSGDSVRLGLYADSDLLAVMTFGKLRPTFGGSETHHGWELSRFCTRIGCYIPGGASKLFDYFVHNYSPSNIVSFSDLSCTSGSIYSILGFECIDEVEPGYVWANPITEQYFKRGSTQKSNLRKLLDDDSIDIHNLSESQIMISRGYVRVYDAGKLKWLWTSPDQRLTSN